MTWTLGILIYVAVSLFFTWCLCRIARSDDDSTYGAEEGDRTFGERR